MYQTYMININQRQLLIYRILNGNLTCLRALNRPPNPGEWYNSTTKEQHVKISLKGLDSSGRHKAQK